MLVAYDQEGKRVYANSGTRHKEIFCPACREPVTHKMGPIMPHHFAHRKESSCPYGKDNKSPWHIHMQELFPPESLERRFYDRETGKIKHIADVFLEESNTVIEFQHSPISAEEFKARTLFHMEEGRRIVWVFDESKEGYKYGKLVKSEFGLSGSWIHQDYCFDWPRSPRKMIEFTCNRNRLDIINQFSICLCLEENEDITHRIIYQTRGYKSVELSVHDILLSGDMNTDDFFRNENYWLNQNPWKEKIEKARTMERERRKREEAQRYKNMSIKLRTKPRRKLRF